MVPDVCLMSLSFLKRHFFKQECPSKGAIVKNRLFLLCFLLCSGVGSSLPMRTHSPGEGMPLYRLTSGSSECEDCSCATCGNWCDCSCFCAKIILPLLVCCGVAFDSCRLFLCPSHCTRIYNPCLPDDELDPRDCVCFGWGHSDDGCVCAWRMFCCLPAQRREYEAT